MTGAFSRRRMMQAASGATGLAALAAFNNCSGLNAIGGSSALASSGELSGNGLASTGASSQNATNVAVKEMISLTDFGADPSGKADSSNAIQLCLNAAAGRPIFVPVGNYLLSKPVTSHVPVKMYGAGPGAGPGVAMTSGCSRFVALFPTGHVFHIFSYFGSEIEGIQFASNVERNSGAYLYFAGPEARNVSNVKVYNCAFVNGAIGVEFFRPSIMDVNSCFFLNSKIHAIKSTTINPVEGGSGFIRANYIFGNINGSYSGIYLDHGYTNVSDNVIINSAIGIHLNVGNFPAGAPKIQGNWIENTTQFGILVETPDGSPCTLLDISFNEFSNVAYSSTQTASIAINDFQGRNWIDVINVVGNQFRNVFNGEAKNIWIKAGTQVNVSSNQISNLGSGGYGIQVGGAIGSHVAVLDNQIVGAYRAKYDLQSGVVKRDNHGD